MLTLDEILNGRPTIDPLEERARELGGGRAVMLVPQQLVDQWLLDPKHLPLLFLDFEKKLNDSSVFEPITSISLKGKLPDAMHLAWAEAASGGWVSGDIPPFKFEQDAVDPSMVNLIWDGPLTRVNYDPCDLIGPGR